MDSEPPVVITCPCGLRATGEPVDTLIVFQGHACEHHERELTVAPKREVSWGAVVAWLGFLVFLAIYVLYPDGLGR